MLFIPTTNLSTISPIYNTLAFPASQDSNSKDSVRPLFSSHFNIEDTEKVLEQKDLICNPSSFGYSIENGDFVFPPFAYPKCSDIQQDPYPTLRFDYDKNLLIAHCDEGTPSYILEPTKQKGRLDQLNEIMDTLHIEKYNGPVKLSNEEYAIGSCDGKTFNSAIYIPRFNSTLREKTLEKMNSLGIKHKPLIVMIITVDSYSRRHFFRKLSKTVEFLNHLPDDYSAFDFKLHNVYGGSSVENMFPVFSDNEPQELDNPREYDVIKNDSMWGYYRSEGFVTLFGLEGCEYSFPNTIGRYPEVDYVIRSFYCTAKGYMNLETEIHNNYAQRCLGNQMSHWYTLNFTQEFTNMYKGLNQWIYMHLSTAHEATGQHAATLDEDLVDFLKKYINDYGKTHELAIFLHADHGMRYGNWYKDIEAYQENKLPAFFLIGSNSLLDRIPDSYENLIINTLRLTTKKDLRPTINYLAQMPYTEGTNFTTGRFVNLFREQAPANRTCEYIGISPFDCSCLVVKEIFNYKEDSQFYDLLITIINEAIYKMNYIVHTPYIGAFGICHKLTFQKIFNVYGMVLNNKVEEIQIKFGVNENDKAVFEVFAFVGTHVKSTVLIASSYRESIVNYAYRGYRSRIKIFGIKRKDKYAGICENAARSLKVKPEYCICNKENMKRFI